MVELVVTVLIVSILFAVGVPSYSGWMQNQQIRAGAESILNGIQVARSEAVKNDSPARFVLCSGSNPLSASWEVLVASAPAAAPPVSLACGANSNAAAGEIRVQERSGQEGSRFAQVTDLVVAGATTVTYNSLGRVVANTDGTASLTSISVTTPATTALPNGGRKLQINVGIAGNPRMCDPSPELAATDPRHC